MSPINAKQFAAAVRTVGLAVSKHHHVPLLDNVVAQVTDGALSLHATDYESWITVHVEADGHPDVGPRLVNHAALAALARGLSKKVKDVVDVDFGPGSVTFTQHEVSRTIGYAEGDLAEFPAPPKAPTRRWKIEDIDLRYAVEQGMVAVGADDLLPVLTGLHFVFANSHLTVESTDRFRLTQAERKVSGKTSAEGLVPARLISKVVPLLDGEVTIRMDDPKMTSVRHVFVEADGVEVVARMIEGEFPKIASLWPSEHAVTAQVDADFLRTAMGSIPGRAETVALHSDGSLLEIRNAEGHKVAAMPVAGDSFAVGFNPRYAEQILRRFKGDRVTLWTGDPSGRKPWVFEHGGERHLLMPRRLLDNGAAAA